MDSVYPNLLKKLKEDGITTPFLAKNLNLTESSVSDKLMGLCDWKLHEAISVCCLLNEPNIELLFVQL